MFLASVKHYLHLLNCPLQWLVRIKQSHKSYNTNTNLKKITKSTTLTQNSTSLCFCCSFCDSVLFLPATVVHSLFSLNPVVSSYLSDKFQMYKVKNSLRRSNGCNKLLTSDVALLVVSINQSSQLNSSRVAWNSYNADTLVALLQHLSTFEWNVVSFLNMIILRMYSSIFNL